jgi:NAD(P)-dependent dehydrogenase (short-subunit alcohol dehydrogenase family)
MNNYIIIGASSGIGLEIANRLSLNGNRVYGTYFKSGVPVKKENLQYSYLDVTEGNLDFSFLPDEVHGLVYCPGSINLKPFKRIKPEEFIEDYQLQVVGAVKTIQAVLPKMYHVENSAIVLFSTVAVQTGFNFHAQVAASKGAIEGLVRSLAAELAPKIRVNGIAPSITDTPLAARLLNSDEKKRLNAERHPLKKIGTPADIAAGVEFLLSEKSSWVTGQIMHVDGGMSAIRI